MGYKIAIDGPAGAGKSTVAKLVAQEKGFVYVDTGALYRALAVYFLNQHVEIADQEAVQKACQDVSVELRFSQQQEVYLNGENVTGLLRQEAVGNLSSKLAAIPAVRERLLETQRQIAREQNVVMDGRDIGTCILPDADLKIYLTASIEARARRRYLELQEKGQACDLEQIKEDIEERDDRDLHREIAPLRQAEDAVYIDSSEMTISDVVDKIVSLCAL